MRAPPPARTAAGRGRVQDRPHRQRLTGDLVHDAAAAEDQCSMADMGHFLEIRGDHQNGEAALEGGIEQGIDLGLGADVHAGRGFLQDQQLLRDLEPTGDDHLLLVAAGERLGRPGRVAGPHAEAPAQPLRMPQLDDRPLPAEGVAAIGGGIEEHVLAHAQRHGQALAGAVAGDQADPFLHGGPGAAEAGGPAGQLHAAGIDRGQPEQRPADLLLAGAAQADQTDHLARAQGQRDGTDRADPQVAQLQGHGLGARRGAHEDLLGWPPDDHRHQLPGRGRRHQLAPHQPPVAQHGHLVRDLEHLVQPVRDVDHPGTAVAQAPQHVEQPVHLVGRQARRRLVQHQQPRLDRQRPGDGHQRALGPRQAGDARVRVDVAADRVQRRGGAAAGSAPVDQPGAAREALAHGHVLGHAHPLDQPQILVDEGDRLGRAGLRRPVPVGLAVEQDLALVEAVDPGQQLDQRRLAGAVLAQQRQDRAGADVEVDPVDRQRAAEALGDAGEAQQQRLSHARRLSGRRTQSWPSRRYACACPLPPLLGRQCRGAARGAQGSIAHPCRPWTFTAGLGPWQVSAAGAGAGRER